MSKKYSVEEGAALYQVMIQMVEQMDSDKVIESGKDVDARIHALIEEETEKGNEGLRVLQLTSMDVLADNDLFNDNTINLMRNAINLKGLMSSIVGLDIPTPETFSEMNMIGYSLTETLRRTFEILYSTYKATVNGTLNAEDSIIGDVIEEAAKDLIKHMMPITTFLEDVGLEHEIPKPPVAVFENGTPNNNYDAQTVKYNEKLDELENIVYGEAYRDYIAEIAYELLEEVLKDSTNSKFLRPIGLDKFKNSMKSLFGSEHDEYIDQLTADQVYLGGIFEKAKEWIGLDIENLTKEEIAAMDKDEFEYKRKLMENFQMAIMLFMEENKSGDIDLGNGQTAPRFLSLSLGEIILHAMLLASAELNDPSVEEDGNEISENTNYIIDIIREFIALGIEEFGDHTPHKILSLMARYTNIFVARNSLSRMYHEPYMAALTNASTIITNDVFAQDAAAKANEEVVEEIPVEEVV